MTPLSRAAFWILDIVVEVRYPLGELADLDADALFAIFNRAEGHGLSKAALTETLLELFEAGLITAEHNDWVTEAARPFVPSPEAIRATFSLPVRREVYYGLTPWGGAVWESHAQPDWNRYCATSQMLDPDIVELTASQRPLVETYVSFAAALLQAAPIAGTVTWDVLTPWQVTYWKELPIGHRVRFAYTPVERSYERGSPEEQAYERAQAWWRANYDWYADPFR